METQELTIKVQEVISKSGIELEIDVTELHTLADKASAITSVNDEGFATVKKELQVKRKEISEGMFQARSEFNRMSKGIIEVEKTLLEIFVPAEQNLIALDKAEKERLIKEARLEALPAKVERMRLAGVEMFDEDILALDDATFELNFAELVRAKAETDRLAAEAKLAEERAAFEAEKAELARKQAEADRIEAARIEERELAAKELQLAKETAEREAKEAIERREREIKESAERAAREQRELEERREAEEQERVLRAEREEAERIAKIEREAKEKADAEIEARRIAMEEENKRQANEKFQAFLTKNKFSNETDIIKQGADGKFRLYRLVATYE